MDGPGDITDEFDDDALRESIEQAERQGQWRENAAGFVDPKLETLKKQLAEAERTHASYAQRRLRELAQRAAAEPAAPAAVVTTAQPADPFAGDWRAAVAPTAPAPSAPNPGSLPEPKYVASARSVHPMRTTLRPLLSGFGVFLPIAVVQTLLTEWHYDVALRLVVAAPLAGANRSICSPTATDRRRAAQALLMNASRSDFSSSRP